MTLVTSIPPIFSSLGAEPSQNVSRALSEKPMIRSVAAIKQGRSYLTAHFDSSSLWRVFYRETGDADVSTSRRSGP